MNCARFQDQVFEYVEESLSAAGQAHAEAHLNHCAACRQYARQEQQTAQFLSGHLRQQVQNLALPPEIRTRIRVARAVDIPFWNRFAWPVGLAASLILVLTLFLSEYPSQAPAPVSVQVSYQVPVQISLKQGNQIIDKLSYQTIEVSETLWADSKKAAPPESKTQL